jgi:hypothetical protein
MPNQKGARNPRSEKQSTMDASRTWQGLTCKIDKTADAKLGCWGDIEHLPVERDASSLLSPTNSCRIPKDS